MAEDGTERRYRAYTRGKIIVTDDGEPLERERDLEKEGHGL